MCDSMYAMVVYCMQWYLPATRIIYRSRCLLHSAIEKCTRYKRISFSLIACLWKSMKVQPSKWRQHVTRIIPVIVHPHLVTCPHIFPFVAFLFTTASNPPLPLNDDRPALSLPHHGPNTRTMGTKIYVRCNGLSILPHTLKTSYNSHHLQDAEFPSVVSRPIGSFKMFTKSRLPLLGDAV